MSINRKKLLLLLVVVVAVVVVLLFLLVRPVVDIAEDLSEGLMTEETKHSEETDSELAVVLGGFEETIGRMNKPEKIVATLNKYFDFIPGKTNLTSRDFFDQREGGERDFASFANHVLRQHNFISFVFGYQYLDHDQNEKISFVTSFRDGEVPKYIYFGEEGAYLTTYGWSYPELCREEESKKDIKILRYSTISSQATELALDEWVELR